MRQDDQRGVDAEARALPRYRMIGRYGGSYECQLADTGEWVRWSDVDQFLTRTLSSERRAREQAEQERDRWRIECERLGNGLVVDAAFAVLDYDDGD